MRVQELGEGSSLLIVGMARSGNAAALMARRMLPQARVVIADHNPEPEGAAGRVELEEAGVQVETGREDNTLLDGCNLLVKSPGVPADIPLFKEAHQRGIPVWGEIEFAWHFLKNPLVGVTGTNGKTTTTELIGHMLRQAGWACRVAGNVGTPLSSLAGKAGDDEILVVELSSFQLEDSIELRPDIAVLLNLGEDHLDRHDDIKAYHEAKMMIFSNQQPDDLAVLNLDDLFLEKMAAPGRAAQLWFSSQGPGAVSAAGIGTGDRIPTVYSDAGDIFYDPVRLMTAAAGVRARLAKSAPAVGGSPRGGRIDTGGGEDSRKVIAWDEAVLKGEHNRENAMAAVAVCLSLGMDTPDVAAGLKSFPGVPHRLQVVGTVDGVTYVNDSKATNVDATLKALTAFSGGIHLILGGSLKGCSFDRLAEAAGAKVREVIVIGEAAEAIGESCRRAGRDVVKAGNLEAAVAAARDSAAAGDVVLLAPACASFDQFRNYEERGETFISLVEQMGDGGK